MQGSLCHGTGTATRTVWRCACWTLRSTAAFLPLQDDTSGYLLPACDNQWLTEPSVLETVHYVWMGHKWHIIHRKIWYRRNGHIDKPVNHDWPICIIWWLSLFWMHWGFVCVYVSVGCRIPGTSVTDSSELPHNCWEPTPGSLEEETVLLTAESSLQPHIFFI